MHIDNNYVLKPDRNIALGLAFYLAVRGETDMLERIRQELIELWNGDGI